MTLISEPVDPQTLYLCKTRNFDVDLDTVLRQWKFTLQNKCIDEQYIYQQFLEQIYPADIIKTMEETVLYER